TPMQWSSDKNAGFSRANPQSLYLPIILDPAYHYEACNVEEQLANPHSLLWWMRRMLSLRKRWRALGEGKCEFLQPENHKILSYVLRHEQETILVVANLSRFAQPVELDLSAFKQMVPVELFGRMKFPVITDAPYPLTLGPHNFYWFSLEPGALPAAAGSGTGTALPLPSIEVTEEWREVFTGKARLRFEAILPEYLKAQPWFPQPARTIKQVTIREFFNMPLPGEAAAVLAFLQVEAVDATPEFYALPVIFSSTGDAPLPQGGIAGITSQLSDLRGVITDAFTVPAFVRALFELLHQREHLRNHHGELQATSTHDLRQILTDTASIEPVVYATGDGNLAIVLGDKLVMKFFRRVEAGTNPELEIGRFLTEKNFPQSPPLLGALECTGEHGPITLAVVNTYVTHAENAWKFFLDGIGRYYDRVFADAAQGHVPPSAPDEVAHGVGISFENARLLGERTASLHLTLASGEEGGEFSIEPMTPQYLRGVFQSMRSLAVQNLRLLRKQAKTLPPDLAAVVQRVNELEPVILQRYRQLVDHRFDAGRIRIHGDFHLGQVLWTGRDFVFLDFEGRISVPISERRIKRSPLRDVARMLRSFHHAAYAGLHQQVESGIISHENLPKFEPWVRHWNVAISRAYLHGYCQKMRGSSILPDDEDKLRMMLQAYLLNQVVDELGDELRHCSENVRASLRAIIILADEQILVPILAAAGKTTPEKHP
ncbi:MAG: alpha-glucosidase C-terminal domain-containing protein, partial [Verrucomicrobia bacterium]|nr:alpha-glucosidase C-terminal domain-containing protein [Verrucomicrobiota bacterium]